MSYGNSQQMLLNQLQNMMGQMASLMQQASNIPMQETAPMLPPTVAAPSPPLRTVQSVHGIEAAREEQSKLKAGESAILLDDNDAVFYMIVKDKEGKSPKKIQVGRFTLEDEPDPPKYVTQDDLASFKQDILDAIKGEKK